MEFNDKDCNAWVVMKPECFVGEHPVNFHIVEVCVTRVDGKISQIVRNADNVSLCGKMTVKSGTQKHHFLAEDEDALRNQIAKMQNDGLEICGVCASRLYADQDVKIP